MDRCWTGFACSLVNLALDTLEKDPSPIFAVSSRWELLYYNPAYSDFAARNGAAPGVLERFPIGSNVLAAIHGPARGLYEARLAACLTGRRPWTLDYDCSGAGLHREFRQLGYPLRNAGGLVLINSVRVELALARAPRRARPARDADYRQATGLITQCSNCRRTLRNDGTDVWDWVPDWVESVPLDTSHSICPPCFDYYWRR